MTIQSKIPDIAHDSSRTPAENSSRLLLLCEEKTSAAYFRAIIAALNLSFRVHLVTPPPGIENTEPMSLVETAYKELAWSRVANRASPYTEVWLVFDRGLHHSYDDALRMLDQLGEPIRAAWSNPSIEYWFLLHYSRATAALKADEELTARCVTRTEENSDGTFTRTTVEHIWRGMKPATMVKHLKEVCRQYKPGELPSDLLSHTSQALENALKASQADKPFKLGTAVPLLMARLLELSPLSPPEKLGYQEEEPPF